MSNAMQVDGVFHVSQIFGLQLIHH